MTVVSDVQDTNTSGHRTDCPGQGDEADHSTNHTAIPLYINVKSLLLHIHTCINRERSSNVGLWSSASSVLQ